MNLAKEIKREFIHLKEHRRFHQTDPQKHQEIRKAVIYSIAKVLHTRNASIPRIALSRKTARELQKALDEIKQINEPSSIKVDGLLPY